MAEQPLINSSLKRPITPSSSEHPECFNILREGSLLSAFLTLFASTVGSGLLTLPVVLRDAGMSAGLFAMAIACTVNLFTSFLLIRLSQRTQRYTLDLVLSDLLFDQLPLLRTKVLLIFTQSSIILNNFGYIVTHAIIVEVVMANALDSNHLKWMFLIGFVYAGLSVLLSHYRQLSTLRYLPLVSFCAVLYVVVHFIISGSERMCFKAGWKWTPLFTNSPIVQSTKYCLCRICRTERRTDRGCCSSH